MLFNTALIHATRGQHERAIADFARAITLDPFFAVAHFQLGVSAFLLGHMAEARRSFDRALSVSLSSRAGMSEPSELNLTLASAAFPRQPYHRLSTVRRTLASVFHR